MKNINEITHLIIDRTKWGRGTTGGALLREDNNKMCCLGFVCCELGVDSERLSGNGMPADIGPSELHENFGWLLAGNDDYGNRNSYDCKRLASINDTDSTTDAEKENQISSIFALHGITVEFVN